ncbi:MAG: M1 family metallopeptidase [Acidobacteria bacterium]|nr:M1 family metallopeptidase [Acidobacteriota bacterium]
MRIVLAAAFALVAALPAAAQRLPGGVTPEHYTLWVAPDIAAATFRGTVDIRVRIDKPTTAITLHAAEIVFDAVTIEAGGKTVPATVAENTKDEMVTFTTPAPLAAGTATIHVKYRGILNDKLRGFYLSKGATRNYAVSQMEATDARRAFPCFDEPAKKATFDVSMTIATGDMAISNGAQVADTPGPEAGTHTVRFATTPKMSTYLVALLVGDFVCREGASDGIAIRVCATPDKKDLTGFAMEAAQFEVKFFNDYFGIKYPFGKLDIIGIPDFAAGAMENAGAITFRERMLLVDEATASIGVRKSVASVIAHELAHQWFGNLVTMKWWDDIWLNEGFATWAANKPLAAWKPEWQMDVNAAEETQTALGLDVLRSTRAIRTKVETPAEINEVFDPIAYEKTSGVINMVEAFVGPEAFRKGVSAYLTRYSSSNAAGEDFWNEVTRVTEKPVNRVMRSFVDQPGAPVLSVSTACVGGQTKVTVRQRRFDSGVGAKPSAPQAWSLPVCVKTDTGKTTCELVSDATQSFSAPGCGAAMVNADARGYYITEYEPAALTALATRSTPLTGAEKVSLLGDEWRLVRAGRHDVGPFLDLAAAFASDPTPSVTGDIAGRLGFVSGAIAGEADRTKLNAWIRAKFGPALDAIGIDPKPGDTDEVQTRRGVLMQLLGSAGDERVRANATALALAYLDRVDSVPPSLIGAALTIAAGAGDAALYDRLVAKMRASAATPDIYYRLFNVLPAFRDPALVQRTLASTLTDDVRSQDVPTVLAQLFGGSQGEATWAFVQQQWEAITKKVGVFQGVPYIVGGLGAFCSTERANEVKAFFDAHPAPAAARSLRQAIERIETCAAIDARQSAPLTAWLATQR